MATANYTGDFLPACYDDWVLEARASLRADALAAFTKLMEKARDSEEPTAVLAHARQVLELEPTDEAAICHQIESHCALGDRNAAMRAYHRYAEAMERELGVAPSEAVRALYQQIRNEFAHPDDGHLVSCARYGAISLTVLEELGS
jgi:DNA-binding SARP family transcriptional activator